MTESVVLEGRYRRLLAWYPRSFRREQEAEMLAVLMAGARPGQRRPGLFETIDLIRSALVMRLRQTGSGSESRPWPDALALFSVLAPLFLLAATVLEVAVPYRVTPAARKFAPGFIGRYGMIGGLHLLNFLTFDIAVGCQLVVAVMALLGLRWLTLAAIAATATCWFLNLYQVPELLQVLSASVYILVSAALIASPGPRRGRQLLSWRHGIVLLLAVAAVQVSTLLNEATSPIVGFLTLARHTPARLGYVVISVVLAAAAASLTAIWRMGWYFALLVAVMLYPYVLQITVPVHSSDDNLIGLPTPEHLTVLFLPALLLALAAIITAVVPRRPPQTQVSAD